MSVASAADAAARPYITLITTAAIISGANTKNRVGHGSRPRDRGSSESASMARSSLVVAGAAALSVVIVRARVEFAIQQRGFTLPGIRSRFNSTYVTLTGLCLPRLLSAGRRIVVETIQTGGLHRLPRLIVESLDLFCVSAVCRDRG